MKNSDVKKLISVAIVLASTTAFADQFIPAQAELSSACQKRIVTATIRACNVDSKASEGEDRMHPCIEDEADITSNHVQSVELSVTYTAGDADEYSYNVDVTDKASCKFTVSSAN